MNVSQFGRGKNAPDVRDMAGRVEFIAQGEVDAVQLAALYWHWTMEPNEHLDAFRKQVLNDYCDKHNVSIHIAK